MKTLKDKRKFGWNKPPKNRNCKKFGIQGRYKQDRKTLHMLLFRTEGWKEKTRKIDFVIKDIKYYYQKYLEGENLFDYFLRYEYYKENYWKTNDGKYYHTLAEHIKELYETLKLRGDVYDNI